MKSLQQAAREARGSGVVLGLLWVLLQNACAPDRVPVDVDVYGLTGTEAQMLLSATLSGRPLADEPAPFTQRLSHFQVRLSPEDTGMLALEVTTLGSDGCAVGAGQTTLAIAGASSYATSLTVMPQTGCSLNVFKTGTGAGQVNLSTGAMLTYPDMMMTQAACPLAQAPSLNMQQTFPLNTQITLTATVPDITQSFFEGWSQGCQGTGSCAVTISSGQATVGAGFERPFICSPDRVCWLQPHPQGTAVQAISGSGSSEAWAVGLSPYFLVWNGSYWDLTNTPVLKEQLQAVSVSGPGEVWTVGQRGVVEHLTGGFWQCPEHITTADLQGVWARAADDVWVAGLQGTLMHWDGASWTPSALPSGVTADLFAIAGLASNDVWAVGGAGTVLHFDGTTWSQVAYPTQDALRAVWPSGPSEAWVAGDNAALAHIVGTNVVVLPVVKPVNWHGIWGASSNNIWVVGDAGFAFFVDGQTPRPIDSATKQDLLAVWGSGISDVWAVGRTGALTHFNGSYWQLVSTNHDDQNYHGIGGPSIAPANLPPAVSIVGDAGLVLLQAGGFFVRDLATAGLLPTNYHAIWGDQASDQWLVGDGGVVVHSDGTTASAQSIGTAADLLAVWGSGATNVLAVGTGGTLAHYDGTMWTAAVLPAAAGNALNAIWGSASNQVFLGGDGGTLLSYDGVTASAVSLAITGSVRGLWGSGPGDVWAVGDAGMLLHFDGTQWTVSKASGRVTTNTLRAVWGSAKNAVWAVGDQGTVLSWNGSMWSKLNSGCDRNLVGVYGLGTQVLFIGDEATILFH